MMCAVSPGRVLWHLQRYILYSVAYAAAQHLPIRFLFTLQECCISTCLLDLEAMGTVLNLSNRSSKATQMLLWPKKYEHSTSFIFPACTVQRWSAASGALLPSASMLQVVRSLPLPVWSRRQRTETVQNTERVQALHAVLLLCSFLQQHYPQACRAAALHAVLALSLCSGLSRRPEGHCCRRRLHRKLTCARRSRSAWRRSASSTLSLAVSVLQGNTL